MVTRAKGQQCSEDFDDLMLSTMYFYDISNIHSHVKRVTSEGLIQHTCAYIHKHTHTHTLTHTHAYTQIFSSPLLQQRAFQKMSLINYLILP